MTEPVIAGAAPAAPVAAPIAPAVVPAPAPVVAAPAPALAAPAAPAVPAVVDPPKEPAYLANRLKDERRKTLKALGVKVGKDDDVDKAIEEFSGKILSRKEENKLLRDALTEFQGEKQTLTAEASEYKDAVASHLATEIALLPQDKRDAVKAALTGGPAAQLKQLAALKALGVQFSAPPPVPVVATPAVVPGAPPAPAPAVPPAPLAAPVTSAPPAPGPIANSPNPTDVKSQYAQLKSSNSKADRVAAAMLALNNSHLLLPDDIA